MTQEEKQLLLNDLSAKSPYGVIVNFTLGDISFNERVSSVFVDERSVQVYVKQGFLKCPLDGDSEIKLSQVKPYLRPLSSMTEDEVNQYYKIRTGEDRNKPLGELDAELFDFYNSRHLDYNELIKKELALEAPAGMYKID